MRGVHFHPLRPPGTLAPAVLPQPPSLAETIMSDPTSSYWLKDALRSALKRDCVDAARDAQRLAEVLASRCNETLAIQP